MPEAESEVQAASSKALKGVRQRAAGAEGVEEEEATEAGLPAGEQEEAEAVVDDRETEPTE